MTDFSHTSGLVLVDFSATWCGPCQMLSPIINEIKIEHQDKLQVINIDVDSDPDIATYYNVNSVPTVIVFQDGQPTHTLIGFRQKKEYLKVLGLSS